MSPPPASPSSAKERRRAAALAAAEHAITTATLDQLQEIVERLLGLTIAARMAKRPREEQAARKALALAERRLAEVVCCSAAGASGSGSNEEAK